MQATMNSGALAPSLRLQFARRDYMVRSEKRRRPEPQRSPEQGSDRPPRRRPPRAGFFYKLLMVILLLTLWPIGLILLWQRKVRWNVLTKLFTSIITLMACILLIGTALTVDTNNPQITAVQNEVGDYLNRATDSLVDFSVALGQRAELSIEAVQDIREVYQGQSLNRAADAIDWGVGIAQTVRERCGEFFASLAPEPTEAPESGETAAPDESAEPGEDIEPEESAEPEAESTEGGEEAEDAEPDVGEEAASAPTSAPAEELQVNADAEELPVYIPAAAPDMDAGIAIVDGGMLRRSGAMEAGAMPTATPEPEPEDLTFVVKPAGEAIVYFNIGSGKFYHMAKVCGSMKNADTHTLAEAAQNIHTPCERCTPPDKALVSETYIVWTDENQLAHLTDECPAFAGQWGLMTAEDAIGAKLTGCAECGADRYLAALADGLEVTVTDAPAAADAEPAEAAEPTPEPTPEATLAPTPEPTPQVVTPRETLKPASRAVVYHSSNGKYYHTNDHCSGMTGGSPYSLAQCVADGYQQCNTCNAPAPESMDRLSLWEDEDKVCHVSDECEYFAGQYTLIDRDEALNSGLTACQHCGAADYLIPFTEVSAYQTLEDAE